MSASTGAGRGPEVSRPAGSDAPRTFYCRGCRLVMTGRQVPDGWYTLIRTSVRGRLRLGLYCSAACLADAMPDIAAAEREHAGRLHTALDPQRDRQRLTERAVTLLGQGMTVRQAGDVIDVPTGTLRYWLSEAGVTLNERGTLDPSTTE